MSPADLPPGAANRAVLTRAASSRTCATEPGGRVARPINIATADSTTIPTSTSPSVIEGMESPLLSVELPDRQRGRTRGSTQRIADGDIWPIVSRVC